MIDLLLVELGSGGDCILRGQDLVTTTGIENEPYISMFGGKEYWANNLLMGDAPFLATTEQVLREVPLNSAGRISIERAVQADLLALKNSITGTEITTTLTILKDNFLSIEINFGGKQFYYLWNPDTLFLTYQIK